MNGRDDAIRVRGLVRAFGDMRALDDVAFDVPRGEVVALLGHNGAGKTTLLRVLNGLLRPTEGQVEVLGMDPMVDGQSIRSRTGVLTEYPALDDFLTIEENLLAYGAMYGVDGSQVRARTGRLLQALGLGDRVHTPTRDLSAGLKQRAALARAMLHEPELLLLDEPTSNLDPLAARRVRELVALRSREYGTTILVSTHNLAEANAIADRVVVLQQGRVLASGAITDLVEAGATPRVAVTTDDATHAAALALVRDTIGDVEALRAPNTFSVPTHVIPVSTTVRRLVEAGVAVESIVPQQPTLEEVYMTLHTQASTPVPPTSEPDDVRAGVSA